MEKEAGCLIEERTIAILRNFFISETDQCIIRLKRNTKIPHKDQEINVSLLGKRVEFESSQRVAKIKKNKPVTKSYELAAIRVMYGVKGKQHPVWLVISRNILPGGLCYLLSQKQSHRTYPK